MLSEINPHKPSEHIKILSPTLANIGVLQTSTFTDSATPKA